MTFSSARKCAALSAKADLSSPCRKPSVCSSPNSNAARLALAIAALDRASIFLGRQAFLASFRGPLFHDLCQLYPLDSVDLGETRSANHKATHLGTLRGRFSLLCHCYIVAYF